MGSGLRTSCYRKAQAHLRVSLPIYEFPRDNTFMSTTFQFKPRTYLHFDGPISAQAAEALVSNPDAVARHSFYPFLGFTIETERMERLPSGEIRSREPKKRLIKIAAHADAAIYAHYARILHEPYERMLERAGISECVTAFRKFPEAGRNNIWFADEAFRFIQANRPCTAIALDIEKFFDRLNHQVLKASWQRVLRVGRLPADHFAIFKSLTKFSWVERSDAYGAVGISEHNPKPQNLNRFRICSPEEFRTKIRNAGHVKFNPDSKKHRGIPQGSPISALLSNIYMFDFDRAMHAAANACGGLYRRYCDDIILIVPPEHAPQVESVAMSFIRLLKLNINPEKTNTICFPVDNTQAALNGKELQYLGFVFDGTAKRIRNSSLLRYYQKMRRGVRLAKLTQRKHNRTAPKLGKPQTALRKRQLHIRYSYLAKRRAYKLPGKEANTKENFITYALRASWWMNAPEIKRQIRNHWPKLNEEIQKAP